MAKVSIPLFYDVSIRNWVSEAGATSIISKIALGQLNEVDIVLAIVQDGIVIELTSPTWILGIKELNAQSGDYLIQETTATKTGTGTATRYTFNFSFDSVELRAFLATLDPNEDYCALEIRDTTNGIVTAPALTISPYAAYTIDGTTPTSALGILVVASGKTATISNTITLTGTDATTYDLDEMGGGGDAVLYTSQTLTSPQKEQARTNIGLPTNTVGLQGADALTLAGINPQIPTLSVTGAEFTESEVSTSGVIFSQVFSNVDEACHGISIAATSGVTPNGDSSIMRILSQDVEQFGFNFNGSPRINSNRQSAWRTQLGLGTLATQSGTAPSGAIVGTTDTQTLTNKSIDAGQLTGDVLLARIATALASPGPIGGTVGATFIRIQSATDGANAFVVKNNGGTAIFDCNTSTRFIQSGGDAFGVSTASGKAYFYNNGQLCWNNADIASNTGTADVGIGRSAAGQLKVTDSSSGFGAISSLYQRFGAGSPEASVTAPVGAIYHRTDGGAGTSFYVKESGSGNTGWVAK